VKRVSLDKLVYVLVRDRSAGTGFFYTFVTSVPICTLQYS
jgi:hypothetical protein